MQSVKTGLREVNNKKQYPENREAISVQFVKGHHVNILTHFYQIIH